MNPAPPVIRILRLKVDIGDGLLVIGYWFLVVERPRMVFGGMEEEGALKGYGLLRGFSLPHCGRALNRLLRAWKGRAQGSMGMILTPPRPAGTPPLEGEGSFLPPVEGAGTWLDEGDLTPPLPCGHPSPRRGGEFFTARGKGGHTARRWGATPAPPLEGEGRGAIWRGGGAGACSRSCGGLRHGSRRGRAGGLGGRLHRTGV